MEVSLPLQPGIGPVQRPSYNTYLCAKEVNDNCVDQVEFHGIVEKGYSPCSSLVTIVAKRNGTPRICVDYRHTLNKFLLGESWTMSDNEPRVNSVGGTRFIAVLNIHATYHQMSIKDADIPKTWFSTGKGEHHFKHLPFGAVNVPGAFARLVDDTFAHFSPRSGLLTYMDDLLVCSTLDCNICSKK